MKAKHLSRLLPIVIMLVAGLVLGAAAPTNAVDRDRKLRAHIVSDSPDPCSPGANKCTWSGTVRIKNNRAPGTGRLLICVGIDVFSSSTNLSRGTSPNGQAHAWVRPQHARTVAFHAGYDPRRETASFVDVVSVHKHVRMGGQPC
jgi:hypothetical protein